MTAPNIQRRELRGANGVWFLDQTRRIYCPCCRYYNARAVFLVFDKHSIYRRSEVYKIGLCYGCNATWEYYQ